jgi:hypothetical protein
MNFINELKMGMIIEHATLKIFYLILTSHKIGTAYITVYDLSNRMIVNLFIRHPYTWNIIST